MKRVILGETTLDSCVDDAQRERVLILREGKPIAFVVGVEGLDEEQIALGSSDSFWSLIADRRAQEVVDRAELERMLDTLPGLD